MDPSWIMINHGVQHIQIYYEQSLSFMHMYVFCFDAARIRFKTRWWHRLKNEVAKHCSKEGYLFFFFFRFGHVFRFLFPCFFTFKFFCFFCFSLFCFSLVLCFYTCLLLCFSTFLLLCFFASLLLRCAASLLLLFSVFPCFSAFPASLLSPFPYFFAYQLFGFS